MTLASHLSSKYSYLHYLWHLSTSNAISITTESSEGTLQIRWKVYSHTERTLISCNSGVCQKKFDICILVWRYENELSNNVHWSITSSWMSFHAKSLFLTIGLFFTTGHSQSQMFTHPSFFTHSRVRHGVKIITNAQHHGGLCPTFTLWKTGVNAGSESQCIHVM